MLSLEETIKECLANKELVIQYRRLTGARLGMGSPIERIIDEKTGYDEKEFFDFFNFIKDYIWMPLITKENETNKV